MGNPKVTRPDPLTLNRLMDSDHRPSLAANLITAGELSHPLASRRALQGHAEEIFGGSNLIDIEAVFARDRRVMCVLQ